MSEERATVEGLMDLIDDVRRYGFTFADFRNIEVFARRLATQAQAPESACFVQAADWLEKESNAVYSVCLREHAEAANWLREHASANPRAPETAEPQPAQGEDAAAARGEEDELAAFETWMLLPNRPCVANTGSAWAGWQARAARAALSAPPAIEPAQGAAEGKDLPMVSMLRWKLKRAIDVLERDGDEHGVAADLREALAAQPKATSPTSTEPKP